MRTLFCHSTAGCAKLADYKASPKLRGQLDLRWRIWIRLTPRFCRKRNEAPVLSDKLVHTFFKGQTVFKG